MLSIKPMVSINNKWVVLFILAIVAWISFSPVLGLKPFEEDNLDELALGLRNDPGFLFTQSYLGLPAYRPIPHFTSWLQYKLVGISSIGSYYLFNILIWVLTVWLVFLILSKITSAFWPAFLAALFLLLDSRALYAVVWICERQSTMACLFGLMAIRFILSACNKEYIVGICLLFAALSKEYGLAFVATAVILLFSLPQKDKKKLIIAIAASVAGYFILRLIFLSGVNPGYCENMGLFFQEHRVCLEELSFGRKMLQYGYNIIATFIGTMLPVIFSGNGVFLPATHKIFSVPAVLLALVGLFNLLLIGLSLVAVKRKTQLALAFIVLILANAVLSFMLYRLRNQLVGMAGFYILAGMGLAFCWDRLKEKLSSIAKVVLVVCIVAALAQAVVFNRIWITKHNQMAASIDPYQTKCVQDDLCEELVMQLEKKYQ